MCRLSMNEMTTYRWSFEEDLQHYRAAGIPALGVWRRKLSDYGERRGIELLKASGLAVSNLMWAGGFTGSEGHTYRESIDDATDAIRLAGEMGAPALVVYSGARAGHTHNHGRRLLTGALAELAPIAAEHRVVLALEPMHAACAGECTFVTSLADACAILDQINSPQVRLSLDTYQMGLGPGVLDQVRNLAKRIAIVHLADGHPPDDEQHRTPLGRGCVPLGEIIHALRDGGYDGDFDVELFGDEISPTDYENLLS
ncbi:MAG TPA: sugar phosphate isomerase/epimerase family protein, partial [Pirellulales bacterium]